MGTNNAINLKASGLANYDGAGGFTAVTTTNHRVLVGAASNDITSLGAMTNGQLVVGSTGNDPATTTITPGAGITVTNGAGSIQLDAVGGGLTWSVPTIDTALVVNHGYGANKVTSLAFTLPAVSAVGDVVSIIGMKAGWNIVQGVGQNIVIGSSSTTPGAGGSLTSTNAFDCIDLVCLVASTTWYVRSVIGNITVV